MYYKKKYKKKKREKKNYLSKLLLRVEFRKKWPGGSHGLYLRYQPGSDYGNCDFQTEDFVVLELAVNSHPS